MYMDGIIRFKNCTFRNHDYTSGKVMLPYNTSANGHIFCDNCIFAGNTAEDNTVYHVRYNANNKTVFNGCTVTDNFAMVNDITTEVVGFNASLYPGRMVRELHQEQIPYEEEIASWGLFGSDFAGCDTNIEYKLRWSHDTPKQQFNIYMDDDLNGNPRPYGGYYCPGAYAYPSVLVDFTTPGYVAVPWWGWIKIDTLYVQDNNPEERAANNYYFYFEAEQGAPSSTGEHARAKSYYVLSKMKDISTVDKGRKTIKFNNIWNLLCFDSTDVITEANFDFDGGTHVFVPNGAANVSVTWKQPSSAQECSRYIRLDIEDLSGEGWVVDYINCKWYRNQYNQSEHEYTSYSNATPQYDDLRVVKFEEREPTAFRFVMLTDIDEETPLHSVDVDYEVNAVYSDTAKRTLFYIGNESAGSFAVKTDWTLDWDKNDRLPIIYAPQYHDNTFIIAPNVPK